MTPIGRGDWAGREPGGDWHDLRERPLGDLIRELLADGQELVRDELRLARAEVREEAKKAAKGTSGIAAGGAVLYAALLLLGATLVLVGATFLAAWLAALIVTALYGIVGYATLSWGKGELRKARPSRAVEHVKEDARWARETMRDVRSSRSANA